MENTRDTSIRIPKDEFKKIGHELVDRLAEFFDTIDTLPVTTTKTPSELREILGNRELPVNGTDPKEMMSKVSDLLINYSLFNGHPKFFGYITSSPAPLGALADMLAAAVNPNVGAQILSPMATTIETQTISWLAEFIGVSPEYAGILVSGGNMANITAFLAARTAKAPAKTKAEGISNDTDKLTVYCSKTTHTWIDKAASLFGLGVNSVRWIPADDSNKMNLQILGETIQTDIENGCTPLMVIGTAGDVSTGAVDDLRGIAAICREYNLWFHVDGAYGIPAAIVPTQKHLFEGIEEADSIAMDPHKWLYSPLEAGCTLVKDKQHLINTFSAHPDYYKFDEVEGEKAQNYLEFGLQNSRGFRALKVWMTLQQVGRRGYENLISEDIELSEYLYKLAGEHAELEAISQNLSIAVFRYTPPPHTSGEGHSEEFLNKLNEELLNILQANGELFLSNAVVNGKYALRACIVNFRTTRKDIEEIVEIIAREGRKVHSKMHAIEG